MPFVFVRSVGHPHPGPVNALTSDSKTVFSCSENKIYAWKGGHKHVSIELLDE